LRTDAVQRGAGRDDRRTAPLNENPARSHAVTSISSNAVDDAVGPADEEAE
jgi:hypothetical protein